MLEYPSDFAFVGPRDYIHAPMIFDALRKGVERAAGMPSEIQVRSFRINSPVLTDGTIRIQPADAGRPANALAEFHAILGGRPFIASVHTGAAKPIDKRVESVEKDLVGPIARGDGILNGSTVLRGLTDNYSLIQAVAEANKQLHLLTLPTRDNGVPARFRFVYCLGFRCPAALPAGEARLAISHDGIRRTGAYTYTLNSLDLSCGSAWSQRFQLCYASSDLAHVGENA